MPDSINSPGQFRGIPLFPLPSVVLFPRAVLPLHIFEDRYRAMTADALTGGRQVAMALLKPGWERDYYARPEIEPVVCVGVILTHELLPDGKYNFLLQGHTRARVVQETPTQGAQFIAGPILNRSQKSRRRKVNWRLCASGWYQSSMAVRSLPRS